ncbi:MAG: LacI family transcriptional regulator [Lachnospiraceae bacterium]|nr:LacI family transcriptional regulator [Lachnospiraceae bacterium]
MNIYDISKLAGVSTATVSRVINGADNVKPSTRDKVLNVIEKNGYTPNAFARGLGLNTMNSVGIMCVDSSDLYIAKAVYCIEGELRENGYHTILTCTGFDRKGKEESLSMLLAQHVDCIIFAGSAFIDDNNDKNNKYIYDAADIVPVMILNACLDHPNIHCVLCDDSIATRDAALFLIDNGRRDILYLYNSRTYSAVRKVAGYRKAFELRRMSCDERYLQFFEGSSRDINGVCNFVTSLRRSGLNFDAILTLDDLLAIGAVKYALRNSISIPDELSIMGYNNSIFTVCCEPEISSVDNRLESMCKNLVSICLDVLSGREAPKKSMFSGMLVHRKTTLL